MYYTGIGSRKTPEEIKTTIEHIATKLQQVGYILRSGGADGADTFFEQKVQNKEIYLPWRNFNGNSSTLFNVGYTAIEIASRHHKGWDRLSDPVKKLMGRNVYQVLGLDLKTPSDFVVCYTPDGCESEKDRTSYTGGTGLAISVADKYGIPIYNIAKEESLEILMFLIESL